MKIVRFRQVFAFSSQSSQDFLKKIYKYQDKINIHQKASQIDPYDVHKFIKTQGKAKLAEQLVQDSKYDDELKDFISKFNNKN